jgi:cysteine desulfurase/selenocysteine lyase
MPIDLKKLKPDFLVFSGHKMYGPTGIGIVYVAPERWPELQPYQTGGDMISLVEWQHSEFKPMPGFLEAGTPALAQVAGLGAAIAYLQKLGWPAVTQHENNLTAYAYQKLSLIPGMKIYGPGPEARGDVIAFTIDGLHAHDLASWLDVRGFCVRAGHHCAQPLHHKLGIPATARIGLAIYNSKIEVDALVSALTEIIKLWPSSTTL